MITPLLTRKATSSMPGLAAQRSTLKLLARHQPRSLSPLRPVQLAPLSEARSLSISHVIRARNNPPSTPKAATATPPPPPLPRAVSPSEEVVWEDLGAHTAEERASLTVGQAWKEQRRYKKRALLFWLSVPLIALIIPSYFSNRHDRKLADLAEGQGGLADSILKRFSFAGLRERGGDRALLETIWRHRMAEDLGKGFKTLMATISSLPQEAKIAISRAYLSTADRFLNLSTGQMSVVPIIAVNTIVFLSWRLSALSPAWTKFMHRHFTDSMSWKRPWTPYTSSFSHQSLVHFGVNQYALWTVGSFALEIATRENEATSPKLPRTTPETDFKYQAFAAFIFSALFGAQLSRFISKRTALRSARSWMMAKNFGATHNMEQGKAKVRESMLRRSLGSSAGVYGLFAASAVVHGGGPDANAHRLGLIGLPVEYSLPISTGFLCMCGFDLFCLVAGLKFFDHAAHLGGAIGGALWAWKGQRDVWIPMRNWWPFVEVSRGKLPQPQQQQKPGQRHQQVFLSEPASTRI